MIDSDSKSVENDEYTLYFNQYNLKQSELVLI